MELVVKIKWVISVKYLAWHPKLLSIYLSAIYLFIYHHLLSQTSS